MAAIDPSALDLPTLASLAGVAANQRVLSQVRAAGFDRIRASHGYVIQLLVDDHPTVGEIAERLGVSQQAASKAIVELVELGVVSRTRDEVDGRVSRVGLTPRGRAVLDAGRAERIELERAVEGDVGDLAAAKRALVSLLEHTGALDDVIRRRARPPADET